MIDCNKDEAIPRTGAGEWAKRVDANGVESMLRKDELELMGGRPRTLYLALMASGENIGDRRTHPFPIVSFLEVVQSLPQPAVSGMSVTLEDE